MQTEVKKITGFFGAEAEDKKIPSGTGESPEGIYRRGENLMREFFHFYIHEAVPCIGSAGGGGDVKAVPSLFFNEHGPAHFLSP